MMNKYYRWISCFTVLLVSSSLALQVEARGPGNGHRGGGGSFSRSGPAARGSVRPTRHAKPARKSGRRDTQRDIREERRDTRRDIREEHHDWHEDRWRRRVGAALTISVFRSLTCGVQRIIVNGIVYYRCGGTWYRRGNQGGDIVYIVIKAPAGY